MQVAIAATRLVSRCYVWVIRLPNTELNRFSKVVNPLWSIDCPPVCLQYQYKESDSVRNRGVLPGTFGDAG